MRFSNSILALVAAALPAQETAGEIELLRDEWGIPHVFAASDEDAMFGLGFAAAEDRAFQMYFHLRIMQGRAAEVLGDAPRRGGRDSAVQHDIKMRTFGFWRHAVRVAARLDAPTRRLLQAYSDGVNAALGRGEPPKLFAAHDLEPEPWTPAACLASWWHVAQFFATDGTRDLNAWRNHVRPRPGRPRPPQLPPDDSAAVVKRSDVEDAWVQRVAAFKERYGLGNPAPAGEGRKWSHAWVVGGAKATTGSAVLVSDPQTPVRNPNLFWEFHVKGATFDARGIGVAGSPVILIGFNRKVAWGVTALGADQADLFRLRVDAERPDHYVVDGEALPFEKRTERIAVRDGEPRAVEVRETVFGPVVSRFAFRRRGEPQVAVKRVPLCDHDIDTHTAAFAMMRARSATELLTALRGWRFPSMNAVFGDADGHIGYTVAGAFPIRSREAVRGGRFAHDGSSRRFDWQGFVPPDWCRGCSIPSAGSC